MSFFGVEKALFTGRVLPDMLSQFRFGKAPIYIEGLDEVTPATTGCPCALVFSSDAAALTHIPPQIAVLCEQPRDAAEETKLAEFIAACVISRDHETREQRFSTAGFRFVSNALLAKNWGINM